MTNKILFVDDDVHLLAGIQRSLRKQFEVDVANSAAEARLLLTQSGPFAVIVADMQMPVMSGLEFLKLAGTLAPDSVRIMLTGNADQKTAMDAVNDGHVFRFLTKPCPPVALVAALEAGLAQYRLIMAERELLENTLGGAVQALTDILAANEPAMFHRLQQLKEYAKAFAASHELRTPSWELELAAMLSQIGRVTIPPPVLAKVRAGLSLTGPEQDVMNRIPEVGARLLERIPRLDNVAAIIRHQEQHFDGSGSLSGQPSGTDLPAGARLLKILGDFLEFESKAVSKQAALQKMSERPGCYDPELFSAVCRHFDVALQEAHRLHPPQPMKVEDLRPGHILGQELRLKDGSLLLATETRLTPTLVEKLLNFRALETIDETILVYAPVTTPPRELAA